MHPVHTKLDFNLLVALDVLLEECSVTAAADRLAMSEPAMSRTLGRIRKVVEDPVLVRAGHTMQPTPRAVAMRSEVRALVQRTRAVLAPAGEPDPGSLTRTFTISANDAMVTSVGDHLLTCVEQQAPKVTLRFLAEPPGDHAGLRDGSIDLQMGVLGPLAPEVHTELLATDHTVMVMRPDHPLAGGELTAERVAAARHIVTSRRGRLSGPVDDALAVRGLGRHAAVVAPTFAATLLMLANRHDVVGLFPWRQYRTNVRTLGLVARELPMPLPPLQLSMAWHPRDDADPAHQWLRSRIRHSAKAVLEPEDVPIG
ncbi:LysR family transcriptional regulator (plasmid) [Streptomyces sp. BHT-5-2]|uniref:LysR family transcriptional regulator n=1 Tax=Streptomyces sp. BHT-5-2 TaxID=2866715 RepID=UPI001C8D6B73|nr:LysR family transcriptional regulator [Streptomyces sp. BHT-5-2]QZL07804.1 LysR family transcriptional regulator [Streptomyces sp. BHT-5-2]